MNKAIAICADCVGRLLEYLPRARKMADESSSELLLLLILPPHRPDTESIEKAMELARRYDAALRVYYAENAERTVQEYMKDELPLAVIAHREGALATGNAVLCPV